MHLGRFGVHPGRFGVHPGEFGVQQMPVISKWTSTSSNNLVSTSPIPSSQNSAPVNSISTNRPNMQSKHNFSAKLDLNTFDTIPENTRTIMLKSLDNKCPLTSFNPIQSGKDLETICGPVKKLKYLRSGNLLITTMNLEQIHKLKNATTFSEKQVPITSSIIWNEQFSYRKLYAPEFRNTSIEKFLEDIKMFNVVAVRKYFADPKKRDYPLYVLTFLGEAPETLKLGYVIYNLDKYYSSPMQCQKCFYYGHSTIKCRNSAICKLCTSKEHTEEKCIALTYKCNNCKQQHRATDKQCPSYLREVEICTLQADMGISFSDACDLHKEQANDVAVDTTAPPTHNSPVPPPNISSQTTFPPIINNSRKQLSSQPNRQMNTTITKHVLPITNPINNSNSDNTQISQNSSWFSQQHSTSITPNSEILCPSQLSLPPLSPQHNTAHNTQQTNHYHNSHSSECYSPSNDTNSNYESTEYSNSPTITEQSNLSLQSITTIFHKLLPLLIKIIFSNTMSDKIESIINIGQILHADNLVSSTLASLNLTSALSQ